MGRRSEYTQEQAEFIKNNYTNISECVRKFNKEFGTNKSYSAIKTYAYRRLGLTTGFRPWTKDMNDAIESILWHHSYKQATDIFNSKFGTSFTVKQIQDHCTRLGIKRNHAKKLARVDAIISENAASKTYKEIMDIVNDELGMGYVNETTICNRANNLGINRPHRVWDPNNDRRYINGKEVTNSEYVRFIGNRWHRLSEELQPIAMEVVRLQSEIADIQKDENRDNDK